MSKISLEGNASGTGTFTVAAPNTNTNYTITLPQETGTLVTTGVSTGLNASALTTGVVAVGVGGTGANTLTSEAVIIGNATSAVKFVSPGTANNVLTSNGTAWVSQAASGGAAGITGQVFTGNGTFTIPSGVTAVKVTVVGGGGGGTDCFPSGCNLFTGGGGGGGGAAIKYLTGLTPGNTLSVTVGGAGSRGNPAGAGGTSSVASGTQSITTVSATGGVSPGTNTVNGGAGGIGSNGDLNIGGGGGVAGMTFGYAAAGGAGGSSIFGGGGAGIYGTVGTAGRAYGGGGSGGPFFAGSPRNGADGAAGAVIFEW